MGWRRFLPSCIEAMGVVLIARDFDGVDDDIRATITAVNTGDWTMGAWVNADTAGEADNGFVFFASVGSTANARLNFNTASLTVVALQVHATTNASATTTDGVTAGVWHLLFGTYTASSVSCAVYWGTLSAPVALKALAFDIPAIGARTTGATNWTIGNNRAGTRTFDGRISRAGFINRLLSVEEMESIRLGGPWPAEPSLLRGYWPLNSPTASQAEDLSGNAANGTVTGALAAEDPPVPMRFEPVRRVGATPSGGWVDRRVPRGVGRGLERVAS